MEKRNGKINKDSLLHAVYVFDLGIYEEVKKCTRKNYEYKEWLRFCTELGVSEYRADKAWSYLWWYQEGVITPKK